MSSEPEPVVMVSEPSVTDSLEELAFAAIGMTTLALDEAGQARELTLAQWRVLVILGRGSKRVGVIAERLGISLPSASRLLARMEAAGLVSSSPDAQDRRAMLVSLTPLGGSTRDGVILRRRRLIDDAVGSEAPLSRLDLRAGLALLAARLSRFA
jgi:DNA-binding MarR family transcriptional regulator